jgi:hypothetical protein
MRPVHQQQQQQPYCYTYLGMTYRQLFSGVASVSGSHSVAYMALPSALKVAGESSGCLSRCGEKPASPRLGSTYLQQCGATARKFVTFVLVHHTLLVGRESCVTTAAVHVPVAVRRNSTQFVGVCVSAPHIVGVGRALRHHSWGPRTCRTNPRGVKLEKCLRCTAHCWCDEMLV